MKTIISLSSHDAELSAEWAMLQEVLHPAKLRNPTRVKSNTDFMMLVALGFVTPNRSTLKTLLAKAGYTLEVFGGAIKGYYAFNEKKQFQIYIILGIGQFQLATY